jgi:hypothetical protein
MPQEGVEFPILGRKLSFMLHLDGLLHFLDSGVTLDNLFPAR